MIYWLCLFFCSIPRSNFANPQSYNMPEANPSYFDPDVEENYGEYGDTWLDSQWYPWDFNSQPEMQPLKRNFMNPHAFHYNKEEKKRRPLGSNQPHHRNIMSNNNTLKTTRPSQSLKSNQGYQSNKEKIDDDEDYGDEYDADLKRNIGKTQSPSTKIKEKKKLEINKTLANGRESKRDNGVLSKGYLPENSLNSYPEMNSNLLKRQNSNIENNEPETDSLRLADTVTESVTGIHFNENDNEDLDSNGQGMQSFGSVYTTEEAISPESITKINNQYEGQEYKIDKYNDVAASNLQNAGQYPGQNSDSVSNTVNKAEFIDMPSMKPGDNLMTRDIDSENDQKYFPESFKAVKSQRAINKTISLQAAPKITFYNENQTAFQDNNTEINVLTSEENSHLHSKRMKNDKSMLGKNQFHKRPKKKPGRPSSHHSEQAFGKEDHSFHHNINQNIARQGANSGEIHETSKTMSNSNGNGKAFSHKMKEKQKSKLAHPQKVGDGSNNENMQMQDFTKNNHDTNKKIKKTLESKHSRNWGDMKTDLRRDINQEKRNSSRKRSAEMKDVTTEKEATIHFKRNFENKHKSSNSSNRKTTKSSSNAIVRRANKLKYKNKMHNYNRPPFMHRKKLPAKSGALNYRKFLHHPNPHHPHFEHKYPKSKSKGRNQKRVSEFLPPSSFEIKELNEPYNYELNIAKHLNNKKSKVDEKLSRTMEDHKVKKTVLKDGQTRKETDIVENENEKVVDKVRVISDPNQKSPPLSSTPVEIPFDQAEPAYPDYEEEGEDERSKDQFAESYSDNMIAAPVQQIVEASVNKAEELDESDPQNADSEDDYDEENKENAVSDNYSDASTDQEVEISETNTESSSVENKVTPNEEDLDNESEPSEEEQEKYSEGYNAYYKKSTEIPPADAKPMEVDKGYLPSANLPQNIPSEHQMYEAPPPPPSDLDYQFPEMNAFYQQNYDIPYGNGKKHKKIYHFSTEFAVSESLDEFEKEEKLEKASKTVVRNKLMTANESSHHFQEKKTEIKNNKESYHEAYIEEKDENKFPRDMDSDDNLQIPNEISQSQSNSADAHLDPDNLGSSVNDNLEVDEDQEVDDQSENEVQPDRISQRFDPYDELNQHENLIDNVKRSQPRLKFSRDAKSNSFTNESQVQEKPHGGRRDASSLNRQSDQVMHKKSESSFEDSPNRDKGVRDSTKQLRDSGTSTWTAPNSESKSGNVVYVTLKTTTVDFEQKYHDFIQIHDDKATSGRYERQPRQYMRKRRKNGNSGKKIFVQ